jgi:hypothetical protein
MFKSGVEECTVTEDINAIKKKPSSLLQDN